MSRTEGRPASRSGRALHPAIVQLGNAPERCLEDFRPDLWQAGNPQPGSPWGRDLLEDRPHSAVPNTRHLHMHPVIAGHWFKVGGADVMLGVRDCLGSDSLYSAGALCRVAMEAFAWGAWIWEPSLPLDNRVMGGLLCRKHQVDQLINNYERRINADRGQSDSRLLTPEEEENAVQIVAHWKQGKPSWPITCIHRWRSPSLPAHERKYDPLVRAASTRSETAARFSFVRPQSH